jgi:phospholipid/cholesterol/gamma-HCH transport system permease protein
MSAAVRADRKGDRACLTPSGQFDLAHVATISKEIARVEMSCGGCPAVELDVGEIEHIDGTGAILLARFLDRLERNGPKAHIVESSNPRAARLIALYRQNRSVVVPAAVNAMGVLPRLGAAAAQAPTVLFHVADFVGRSAAAVPKAAIMPRSVDWRSVPYFVQQVGADGWPVTSAANLLVGLIIGFLGVSELERFGATSYVPELVVVAQFRELGPLVTAIVVAGRSGAGLASEIATMKVSEEIDALRSIGLDPVRWLVIPRCLALVLSIPLLTWVGDLIALLGGLAATTSMTTMPLREYIAATSAAITARNLVSGLVKAPFLALAIGIIACGQGLLTHGGAAAVGQRTTTAVVLSIFAVIAISALFTCLYALLHI